MDNRGDTSLPAGLMKRSSAVTIDEILIYAVGYASGVAEPDLFDLASGDGHLWKVFLIYWAANTIYHTIFEGSPLQATPGKMIVGIKVTDEDGNPAGYQRAAMRQLCKVASSATLGIGFVMAIFSDRKQALHDKLAGCLVVLS